MCISLPMGLVGPVDANSHSLCLSVMSWPSVATEGQAAMANQTTTSWAVAVGFWPLGCDKGRAESPGNVSTVVRWLFVAARCRVCCKNIGPLACIGCTHAMRLADLHGDIAHVERMYIRGSSRRPRSWAQRVLLHGSSCGVISPLPAATTNRNM
jgi:hypothetical protein